MTPFTRSASLIAGATSVLLAGCTVGPSFKAPAPPAAQSYRMEGDPSANEAAMGDRLAGDWWALFHSPEIDQTIREAVAGNRTLEATRQSLAEARDAIAAQAPAATLNASGAIQEQRVNLAAFGFSSLPLGRGGASVSLSNPTFTSYSFGLSGAYDFDVFGQRRREHERLVSLADAQADDADAAYLTLTSDVVGEAVAVAGLRAEIAANEQIVASDQADLDMVTKSYQFGGGTRLDVVTEQTQLASDEAQITPLRAQLGAARHALALLVGKPPAAGSPPDFDLGQIQQPASLPVELPSELVHDRPDIQAAEAQLHAAMAQIGVAKADLYPKVMLTASIAQTSLSPSSFFTWGASGFNIGPTVSFPILGRPQLRAKVRMAEDEARGALADYQQVVLAAFVQVADSLQAVAFDDQLIKQTDQQLAAATENLTLQRQRYEAGKSPLLPVLDAQRSYARASLATVASRAQRLQDSAALLYAVSHNWDRAGTIEPQRTSLADVTR
ncbi:MAG TPA: efflux transporter outer membrane subunit [Caulobacteraceae bacterium]|nr:efflux transporter outer membrane subunit [Caulobacteraceae bacterium]